MAPNSSRDRELGGLRPVRSQNLRQLRTRLRKAPDGKVLGVFKGIADSMGWSVRLTRWLGCVALVGLSGTFGVDGITGTLLACGFFYMLVSVLMGPPRPQPSAEESTAGPLRVDWTAGQPPRRLPDAAASSPSLHGPRADLASLDRQLEGLNRRIRRMESVVTDPAYDWERRLGK